MTTTQNTKYKKENSWSKSVNAKWIVKLLLHRELFDDDGKDNRPILPQNVPWETFQKPTLPYSS